MYEHDFSFISFLQENRQETREVRGRDGIISDYYQTI